MNKTISDYKMDVVGIKKEDPLSLPKIKYTVTIELKDISDDEIQSVIKRTEEISPVWIAIRNNVEVDWQYNIINQ